MPDEPQSDQPDTPQPDQPDQPDPQGDDIDWKAEARKWESRAKKDAERAKANAKAAKDLEDFKQKSMSEAERAIESARQEGRTVALTEMAGKVATAEIRSAAAGRMGDEQISSLIENLDMSRFLTADGDADRDAITAFIDSIAPQTPGAFPDLGQGARQTTPLNGDPLLRDLKSKLGIR